MVSLTSILEHNQRFVREKKYEPYKTTKFPSKSSSLSPVWIQGSQNFFRKQWDLKTVMLKL